MSQNDFTIANQSFPAFRADLNSALQALASNNSGTSAPSTTFANMWWYDSTNNIMYIRNEDNDAWIKFAELDQTNDKFVLSGTLQLDDGTVSAPALTFNSDTNMGIYRGGTDILKFVTAGTDAITIDASQNVGIGIATPTSKLQLLGGTSGLDQLSLSSNLTNNTIKFAGVIMTNYANTTTALLGAKAESGSTSIYYGSSGTDHRGPQNHIFYTNVSPTATSGNTKRMQIGNNGDILLGYEDTGTTPKLFWDASAESLGIGTTTPSQKVESSSATNNIINSKTTLSTALSGFTAYGNSTSHIKMFQFGSAYGGTAFAGLTGNNQAIIEAQEASSLVISTQGGTPDIVFAPARTARMTITNAGNVGIGNTNPEDFGSLVDNLVIGTTSGENGMTIASGTSNSGRIQFADNTSSPFRGAIEYAHSSDAMLFYTAGSQRMRIDSSGRLLVNQTANTGFRFVSTALGAEGCVDCISSSTNGYYALRIDMHANNNYAVLFRQGGSNVGSILTQSGATSYNTSSDYRLKESVTYDFDATTRLKQLKPCRFNFKAYADTTVDGFLAHEVQSVVPEAITGTHNEVDANGNPVYQGIDQSKLVPLLVKTIQELEARITALETA